MSTNLFKNYRIDREVGKGGMATIHLAHEVATGRAVAIKFLLPHVASNETFVRQFMEEFRANQFLKHANIVETIEGGEHEGRWYIAMEFLDGGSLKELIRDRPRLPLDLAVHVIINILKGLQHSHQSGIVHQDMKPANVMVQLDGSIKIADFGISKIASPAAWTATGKIRGTPAYMAPEQAAGKEPTYKWDIFSTGVVFYELIAGFNPFGAPDPQVALRRITGENPPPLVRSVPTLPFDIDQIVARMLEKDPERRYPNVDTLLNDLQRATAKLQLHYSQEVFRDWVQDPERLSGALVTHRANMLLEGAKKLLAGGKGLAEVAIWAIYRAALLEPTSQEARVLLHDAARENGFSLQKSNSMGIQSIESKLLEKQDDVRLLLQAARLYRAEASVLQACYFARAALSAAPLDPGVAATVDKLLGAGAVKQF